MGLAYSRLVKVEWDSVRSDRNHRLAPLRREQRAARRIARDALGSPRRREYICQHSRPIDISRFTWGSHPKMA